MMRHSIFSGLALMREDIPRPLAWKRWKTDLIDICFATNGLLAQLFSLEECELQYGEEVIIPLDPGEAVESTAAELLNHKLRADKFKEFEINSKDLRNAFLQLPSDLLKPMQLRGSLRQRTIRYMFTTIDNKLSALLQRDFDSIESRLEVMWDPSVDTEVFLAGKLELFEDLVDAGQPKPPLEKVNIIIKCLPPNHFQRCIEAFFEKYDNVAKQTVTRLCKHVNKYATNVLPRATRGTAMVAIDSPLAGLSEEAIDRLALALETRLGSRSADAGTSENKPRLYCWTHGPCNHLSKNCTAQQPGHKIEATASKKLGGAEVFTSYRIKNTTRKQST